MRISKCMPRAILISSLLSVLAHAQTLSPRSATTAVSEFPDNPIPAAVRIVMKHYIEEMAERRLLIQTTVTEFDESGKVVRTDHYNGGRR